MHSLFKPIQINAWILNSPLIISFRHRLFWAVAGCFVLISPIVAGPYFLKPEWLHLLFYQKTASGYESLAIDSTFFVSPEGRTDPEAEFNASVQLVQSKDLSFKQHFPLRYKRLCAYLAIPYEPAVQINPDIESVTLGFPSHYMANPSSIFGHLFLLLKSKHGMIQSQILHFIASTEGTNPNLYVVNGLTGVFKGRYFLEPYFKKIKHYNYEDDREVVYYDMSLTPSQIEDSQLFFIEAAQTRFNYFFLDGNCAVYIANFLEVILGYPMAPDDQIVLPADVIATAYSHELLLNEYHRPPSTQLFYQSYFHLTHPERDAVLALSTMPIDPDSPPSESESVSQTSLKTVDPSLVEQTNVLKSFLMISEYLINNNNSLSETVRSNRLYAYRTLHDRQDAHVRPEFKHSPMVIPPKSKNLQVEYGLNERIMMSYTPIYFSVQSPMETKQVSALKTRFSHGLDRPLSADITLADLVSISPFNKMVGSKSWTISSMVGYGDYTYTHTAGMLGAGFLHSDYGKVFALAGVGFSNYNPIVDTAYVEAAVIPLVRVGIDGSFLHNRVVSSLVYDFLHGRSYIVGTVGTRFSWGVVELKGIYSEEEVLSRGGVRIEF